METTTWVIKTMLFIATIVLIEQYRLKSRHSEELLRKKLEEIDALSFTELSARIGQYPRSETISYKDEKYWFGWLVSPVGSPGDRDITDLEIHIFVNFFTIIPFLPFRIGRGITYIKKKDGT